ncbi:FK506-binding protein 5-like isoform X4 [Tachysurus fulvidraco]|uniref:FK506-binding protein 5-like isoform X4 n=1 Tax=Tachysurus fulvidraco TaxID=1234273 RepID=UPI001FEE2388|nr:FK506-binding protein 5-like isoform X4 [Tachysurus fulvidraco]
MQESMKTTRQLPVRGSKMSAAGPSSIRRQDDVIQQTLARKPPTGKVQQTSRVFSMYDVSTNPKESVPFSKASGYGSRMKLSGDRGQRASAGPAAKGPRRDLIRAKLSMEETVHDSQIKSPDNRLPGKFIMSTPKDLSQMTKRLDEGVRPSAKPKLEVKDMTPRDITVQKKQADRSLRDVPKTDKTVEDKTEVKPENKVLRDKIARDIVHYIQSASYKKKLTERFMEEISLHLENALSQSQELQHALQDQSGVQPEVLMFPSTARSCRQDCTSELGFSLCVTSLIGFSLIESRDEIIECIKSVSSKTPSVTKTSTEIVKNVFESILASLIDVDTLNTDKDIDRLSPDSMTSTLASHVYNVKRACECILQRINSEESQRSLHEPADRADERNQTAFGPADESDLDHGNLQDFSVTDITDKSPLEEVTAPSEEVPQSENVPSEVDEQDLTTTQDHAFMKIIKKVKNIWISKNQDESSEAEVKGEHEDQSISEDFIPPPQTSTTEQDLKTSDYVAEEQLVPELVVDLDQPSSSEETVPSEVDEQDLQLIGHQEVASPVPSPETSEMAVVDSPRGSAKLSRTKASPLPDKSDTESSTIIQEKEDVFKQTLSLTDMVKAVSLKSAEKKEVKEILLTEFKKLSLMSSISLDQDQSSGPEVTGKEEEEEEEEEEKSIMAVSEAISHLDDLLASRDEMSDSDLAKSVHEKVTATFGEVTNLEEDTAEKATIEVPVPLSIPYISDIDMVMCPKSLDQDQSSSIEEDLRPEEGAEEMSDSDLAKSVREKVTATFGEVTNLEEDTAEKATIEVPVPLSIPYISDIDMVMCPKSLDQDQSSSIEEDLRPEEEEEEEEEAEEQLQDDSDVDHEQVLATPSEENLPSEVTDQNGQPIEHQEVASPVPSQCSSEMADSPRGPATIRTGRRTKASALQNIPLSIPDKSDTESSTIIHKREDVFKTTLSLTDMVKAVSLKSAEKKEVKEILLTEFKKLSLMSSISLDQDQSSGPEITGKEEEEEEEEEEEKSIMAVSETISHLDEPLASRDEMSDSDLSKSVHEKVTATSGESGEVSNLEEDTAEKATIEVPVPLSIPYISDIDMVMCPTSLDQDQSSSIEEDLRPEEGAEEQLSDDSVLTTPSETAAQDLQLIGHQEHPSLVPSPPSTKKPDSTKGSARRKTRPTKKFRFLSNMAKGMKKSSGCLSTTSDNLSLASSRTFDLEEVTEESTEHRPATSDDVSKKCFLV